MFCSDVIGRLRLRPNILATPIPKALDSTNHIYKMVQPTELRCLSDFDDYMNLDLGVEFSWSWLVFVINEEHKDHPSLEDEGDSETRRR